MGDNKFVSILSSCNFSDRNQDSHLNIVDKKRNIYYAFEEYIQCLEGNFVIENREDAKKVLRDEIEKLRKEQKKYYVPSILESARYDLVKFNNCSKSLLEKSSFALVKKIRNK